VLGATRSLADLLWLQAGRRCGDAVGNAAAARMPMQVRCWMKRTGALGARAHPTTERRMEERQRGALPARE
jgi:hypothetical protein